MDRVRYPAWLIGPLLAAALVVVRAQEPVYRAAVRTVPVYATVIGPDGRLVTDLDRDAFRVFDDGRPQAISLFDNSIQRISIVVMLDMSGSMSGNLGVLRSAAVQMFTRLLPADKARVGSFGNRIVLSPDSFTNDVDALTRALWLDLEPGGPTPLWGAINAAMASLSPLDGRRVVLVLSDGKNTGRRVVNGLPTGPTLEETTERALTEDYMVYAIGMGSNVAVVPRAGTGGGTGGFGGRRRGRVPPVAYGFGGSGEPDPGLREIAAKSGGGYFDLTGAEHLGPVFARVADELHHQYLLGYEPPAFDGRVHQIEVRVGDPRLRVRARTSYRAATRR